MRGKTLGARVARNACPGGKGPRTRIRRSGIGFGRLLLIEYVFLEVVTVLLAGRGHRAALDVADILLDAEEVDFLPCSDLVDHHGG